MVLPVDKSVDAEERGLMSRVSVGPHVLLTITALCRGVQPR